MNENILKIILGKEHTENPIVNYLSYLQKGKDISPTSKNLFNKKYVCVKQIPPALVDGIYLALTPNSKTIILITGILLHFVL